MQVKYTLFGAEYNVLVPGYFPKATLLLAGLCKQSGAGVTSGETKEDTLQNIIF